MQEALRAAGAALARSTASPTAHGRWLLYGGRSIDWLRRGWLRSESSRLLVGPDEVVAALEPGLRTAPMTGHSGGGRADRGAATPRPALPRAATPRCPRRPARPHPPRRRWAVDRSDRLGVPGAGPRPRWRSGSPRQAPGARPTRSRSGYRPTGPLTDRLAVVLHVLYLVFNEGYTTSAGPALQRPDLTVEALRLARLLPVLLPDEGEVAGCSP